MFLKTVLMISFPNNIYHQQKFFSTLIEVSSSGKVVNGFLSSKIKSASIPFCKEPNFGVSFIAEALTV